MSDNLLFSKIPLDIEGNFNIHEDTSFIYEKSVCLLNSGDSVSLTLPSFYRIVEIVFLRHPYSGNVKIKLANELYEFDLFSMEFEKWSLIIPLSGIDDEYKRLVITSLNNKNLYSQGYEVHILAINGIKKKDFFFKEEFKEAQWMPSGQLEPDFEYLKEKNRFYCIAFTPRCGSTYLCDLLTINGYGYPNEYFQPPFGVANSWHYMKLGLHRPGFSADFAKFFKLLIYRFSQNNYFGFKVAWHQYRALLFALSKSFLQINHLNDLIPQTKWIYLRRRDKLAQSISLWRAEKNSIWHSTDSPANQNDYPDYDYYGILFRMFKILLDEFLWEDYFSQWAIDALSIWYEDLVDKPELFMKKIANWIGSGDVDLSSSKLIIFSKFTKIAVPDELQKLKKQMWNDLYHMGVDEYFLDRSDQKQRWNTFFEREYWRGK